MLRVNGESPRENAVLAPRVNLSITSYGRGFFFTDPGLGCPHGIITFTLDYFCFCFNGNGLPVAGLCRQRLWQRPDRRGDYCLRQCADPTDPALGDPAHQYFDLGTVHLGDQRLDFKDVRGHHPGLRSQNLGIGLLRRLGHGTAEYAGVLADLPSTAGGLIKIHS